MAPHAPTRKKKDSPLRHRWRAIKFTLIQHLLLPLLFPLVWLYLRSWRITMGPDDHARAPFGDGEAGAVAVLHGHMLALLGVLSRPWYGRRMGITVITSPSRDGQLQAALLRWLGQKTVVGSSKRGGAAGLLGLRGSIRDGRLGVIAVDGPRGPYGVAKSGILTLAEHGRVPLWIVLTRATPALTLGSWDRQAIPAPFARVECRVFRVPLLPGQPPDDQLALLQSCLRDEMQALGYPADQLPPQTIPTETS